VNNENRGSKLLIQTHQASHWFNIEASATYFLQTLNFHLLEKNLKLNWKRKKIKKFVKKRKRGLLSIKKFRCEKISNLFIWLSDIFRHNAPIAFGRVCGNYSSIDSRFFFFLFIYPIRTYVAATYFIINSSSENGEKERKEREWPKAC